MTAILEIYSYKLFNIEHEENNCYLTCLLLKGYLLEREIKAGCKGKKLVLA